MTSDVGAGPAVPAQGGARSGLRAAAGTFGAVFGAGTLVVPAALAASPASAGYSLALAGGLLAWCLLLSAAGGTRDGGVADLVRGRSGPAAVRVVHGLYFGGIAAGQAALALAVGHLAAPGPAAALTAAGVLVVAATAAASGLTLPAGVRHARLAAVLVVAALCRLQPGYLDVDGVVGPFGGALPLCLVLLFAWVGLEGAVPALRSGRRAALAGTLIAFLGAAALYAVLLTPGPESAGPAPAAPAVRLSAAVLLGTYLLSNLRAAGGHWDPMRGAGGAPPGGRRGVLAASGVAAAVLAAASVTGWSVAAVLLLPGAATAGIYTVLAVASLRRPPGEAVRPRRTAASDPL